MQSGVRHRDSLQLFLRLSLNFCVWCVCVCVCVCVCMWRGERGLSFDGRMRVVRCCNRERICVCMYTYIHTYVCTCVRIIGWHFDALTVVGLTTRKRRRSRGMYECVYMYVCMYVYLCMRVLFFCHKKRVCAYVLHVYLVCNVHTRKHTHRMYIHIRMYICAYMLNMCLT